MRALLSTLTFDNAYPTKVPLPAVHKGDALKILVNFQTSDPNETGEGETLVLQSTGGFRQVYPVAYQSQSYQAYTAAKDGESFSAYINGADGDETATITITAPGADLSASIKSNAVHPQGQATLQLNHIFPTEKVVVPVVVQNVGTNAATGHADIRYYISPTSIYDPATANPVQVGNLASQMISLKPLQSKTFTGTITVPNLKILNPGVKIYIIARVVSDFTENDADADGNDLNNVAATQQYEYLRNPGPYFSPSLYFRVINNTLGNPPLNPFTGQNSKNADPTDGLHFTAIFENPGGYDHPVTHPYNDTATPPKATIGTGLNLKALDPDVEIALAADVRAYYKSHNMGDLSKKSDDQIVDMLIAQADAGNTTQVIDESSAIALYNMTYQRHLATVRALAPKTTGKVLTVLVDIDFNSAGGVAAFSNLLKDVNANTFDAVLAGFDMLDSQRSGQVGYDRLLADYEYLLSGSESTLGTISAT